MKRVWKVTGCAASLGIPRKHTLALLPKTVAGQKIDYIVLDDATDSLAMIEIVGDEWKLAGDRDNQRRGQDENPKNTRRVQLTRLFSCSRDAGNTSLGIAEPDR